MSKLTWYEEYAYIAGRNYVEYRSTDEGYYIWADGEFGWKLSRGNEEGVALAHSLDDPLGLQNLAQKIENVLSGDPKTVAEAQERLIALDAEVEHIRALLSGAAERVEGSELPHFMHGPWCEPGCVLGQTGPT